MTFFRECAKALPAGLILAGALLAQTPAWADSEGTETRSVPEFNRIVIQGAVDVYVNAGKTQKLNVTAERDYLSRVDTRVEGKTLYVEQKGRRWHDVNVSLDIDVKALTSLAIEGAADSVIKGVDSETFDLRIDGAGDITIDGQCGTCTIEINGAGDIDARKFLCKTVEITINGAGDADVYASESVEANLNGVGDITVYGNPPRVRPKIAGIGSFQVVDE